MQDKIPFVIKRNKVVAIVRCTVCLIFDTPLNSVQLHLKIKYHIISKPLYIARYVIIWINILLVYKNCKFSRSAVKQCYVSCCGQSNLQWVSMLVTLFQTMQSLVNIHKSCTGKSRQKKRWMLNTGKHAIWISTLSTRNKVFV